MPSSQLSRGRAWALLTPVCLAAAVVIYAVIFDVTHRGTGMRTATTGAASVIQSPPGAAIETVVRLEGADQTDVYLAELLESVDGTTYRETANHVHVALTSETELIMGSAADVRPGAVVQVAGKIDRECTIWAARVVILNGYIRVAPG